MAAGGWRRAGGGGGRRRAFRKSAIKTLVSKNQPSTFSARNTRQLSHGLNEETLRQYRMSGITDDMLIASHIRYDTNSIPNAHSQYRKMKKDWRDYVYSARSRIQGLGLYAKRDLDM